MDKIECFENEYHFLSNFYKAPVMFEGVLYTNNEAAFQSAKVLSKEERKVFMKMEPNKSKSKGRQVKLRSDWEQVKDDVMYQCVKDKFARNKRLKEKLLQTKNAELVEGNWWNDDYWGVCKGKGQNKLGKILMRVRRELSAN